MRVLFVVFLIGLFTSAGSGQDQKPLLPLARWNIDYAEKNWGLKLKSVSQSLGKYSLLMEFTKDLKPEQLRTLQEAFPGKAPSSTTEFVFLDQDNIVIEKSPKFNIVGDLTGVKGDAFRLETFPVDTMKIAKAELRPIKK